MSFLDQIQFSCVELNLFGYYNKSAYYKINNQFKFNNSFKLQIKQIISQKMNKRGVTPSNQTKADNLCRQPPRRVFGKDLKNIITSYHNKLTQSSAKINNNNKSMAQGNLEGKINQKGNIRNNSQKFIKKDQRFSSKEIKESNRLDNEQKKSMGQSTQASPKSMSIKDHLKQKAQKAVSKISSDLPINLSMRELVVSWIIQLMHKLPLKVQTLFHCVLLFDHILANYKSSNLSGMILCLENLQLLAMTCVFISAKYEQIYPPPADIISRASDYAYSKKKIIQMQANILLQKNFDLTFPTRYIFVQQIINQQFQIQSYKSKRLQHMATFLLEISLLQLWQDSTEQQLAEACLFLAKKSLGMPTEIPIRKICQLSWNLIYIWKQKRNSIVSFIFDSDRFSFVGGIYLQQI